MTNTDAQLEQLFELEKQLNVLLDEEQYDLFLQQQDLFSSKIKDLLDNSSEEALATVLEQLRELEKAIQALQTRSDTYYQQLKEKSLLLQRNKSKIKAYK